MSANTTHRQREFAAGVASCSNSLHTGSCCFHGENTVFSCCSRFGHNCEIIVSDIISVGTEITEVVRVGRLIERHGEHFLRRIFTDNEIALCRERREYLQYFTALWTSKRAVAKLFDLARNFHWPDIEIVLAGPHSWSVELHGSLRDDFRRSKIRSILISMSHCHSHATATAIGID